MKKFAIAAFALLAGLSTASLHAQSTEIRANIPFNFTVSGKTLPAGTYRFYSVHGNTLVIQNVNRSAGVLSHIDTKDTAQPDLRSIVFNKYGDHYFLREVQSSVADLNGQLPVTKSEKQAQQLEASIPAENVKVALGGY